MNAERDPRAWNELAWARLIAGQPDLALEYAQRAHALSRRNIDYLNTLGIAQAETGALEAAEATFTKALKLSPVNVDVLVNLGKVLEKRDALPAALKFYQRAYAVSPSFPKLAVTLARLYRYVGAAERARELLETAVVEDEDLVMARAECDFELDGEAAALGRLRAAVKERPNWQLARGALGHLLLATARWREGWQFYRGRQGASLPEKRVLLRGEQGIGDVLFFLRFAPALRARGVAIAVACEKKLRSILAPGPVLDEILDDTGEGVPIGDLPLMLGSQDTPSPWPLEARERASLEKLGPPPYVGVTWRAGTDLARRRELGQDPSPLMKAIAPALLGKALRGWPGTVIVLQRGARPGDAAEFGAALQGPFHDLSALGEDLPGLLCVLASLDDYVGVSNANVHFLAGLGKTARVLVPYPGEWRWMRRPGPSPWFPGFETYRQPRNRDWTATLADLRAKLFSSCR
ncbi:MAG TPA: tetratricopeptide repeat-containing glycosyltransferase family protein [Burkholderiales bacterium]|nr:tetratricopeptide repeat-containing glycosyltransferase family protein [Burkholderiales bacterium]